MADEHDIASGIEERDRDAALAAPAQRMAKITPADECGHCGVALEAHRRQWGCCIHCASREEQRLRGVRS